MSALTKPITLPNLDAIPAELRQRPQWVAWCYTTNGKLPIDPKTGKAASSTDPSTWTDFRTAYKYAQNRRCGVGFVFSPEDPFCGIDLDDCRSQSTGAIKAETWQILEALNSYSEVSPSGCGIKTIVKAKLGRAYKDRHIEIYPHSRFFTLTGRTIPGLPTEIADAQTAIDALISERSLGGNGHRPDPIPQNIVEGARNDTLFRLACSLRDKGLNQTAIEAALQAVNTEHCSPPLADDEVAAIAKSACRYEPGELNPPTAKVGQKTTENGAKKTAIETTEDVTLLRLSDVQPEPVRWLWPGRIPLGKLTILDGDPGLGKSLLTIDLAARVSTGDPMPDGTTSDCEGPAGVVLLTAEDDPADTIRPRLDAAGADCTRIVLVQAIRELTILPDDAIRERTRLPNLGDIAALEKAIAEVEAKLIIVDPVMAYTAGADTHVDSEVRSVLSRLAELAQRTGVAILAVRHLNKAGGSNPLYRGGGSIGFIASARSGLLVAPDPDDMEGKRRILASTKSNLAELPKSLAYTIEAPTSVAKITWLGTSDQTARTLLAAPSDDEERNAIDEAKDFLLSLLADGPIEAKQVKAEARDAGIAERTLARAKQLLAVQAVKSGFGDSGKWLWCLPSVNQSGKQPKDAKNPLRMPKNTNIESLASLGSFGTLRLSDRLQTDDVDCGPLQGEILARAERHNWPELPYAQGRRVLGGRANWQKAVEWGSVKELTLILEALREFGDD